jgi:hypothetical protein
MPYPILGEGLAGGLAIAACGKISSICAAVLSFTIYMSLPVRLLL